MENNIEVEGLTRKFKNGPLAVAGIDLHVDPGEIYGFLGPNGAGKSTTVHMLTTLLPPTDGTARVAGHDIVREGPAVRAAIGAALQEAALDPHLTGREHMRLQTALHGLPREERVARGDALIERVGLLDAADRKVGRLLGRDETPPRPRPGPGPRAARPLPRRADDRSRPAEPGGAVGRGVPPRRPGGGHRLPHHPVPGGGRRARRPGRDHRRRQDRRRGDAGRAQGRDRPAQPRDHPVQIDAERPGARRHAAIRRARAGGPRRGGGSSRERSARGSPTSSGRSTPRACGSTTSTSTLRASTTSSSRRPAATSRAPATTARCRPANNPSRGPQRERRHRRRPGGLEPQARPSRLRSSPSPVARRCAPCASRR